MQRGVPLVALEASSHQSLDQETLAVYVSSLVGDGLITKRPQNGDKRLKWRCINVRTCIPESRSCSQNPISQGGGNGDTFVGGFSIANKINTPAEWRRRKPSTGIGT